MPNLKVSVSWQSRPNGVLSFPGSISLRNLLCCCGAADSACPLFLPPLSTWRPQQILIRTHLPSHSASENLASSHFLSYCPHGPWPLGHVHFTYYHPPNFVCYSQPVLFMENLSFLVTKDSYRALKTPTYFAFWFSVQIPQMASHLKTVAKTLTLAFYNVSHYFLS